MNILCVNELNFDLWRSSLENLVQKCDGRISKGIINYDYSSGYLEPWAQWPSFFFGMESDQLGIKELGQRVHHNFAKPLWDSEDQKSSLIWGMMNGYTTLERKHVVFPDPWSIDLGSVSPEFQEIASSISALARDYLNLTIEKKIRAVWAILKLRSYLKFTDYCWVAKALVRWSWRLRGTSLLYIGIYELLMARVFTRVAHEKNIQGLKLLFQNLWAHIQHHYWNRGDSLAKEAVLFGEWALGQNISYLDQNSFFSKPWMIINGLDQENCIGKEDWVLYRPVSHKALFEKLLPGQDFYIREAMTNDGHLDFSSADEVENAHELLGQWMLDGDSLLSVERSGLSLFYRPKRFTTLSPDALIVNRVTGEVLRFFDFFDFVARRTGRHVKTFHYMTNDETLVTEDMTIAKVGQIVFSRNLSS